VEQVVLVLILIQLGLPQHQLEQVVITQVVVVLVRMLAEQAALEAQEAVALGAMEAQVWLVSQELPIQAEVVVEAQAHLLPMAV
jgi:hypothetical protein